VFAAPDTDTDTGAAGGFKAPDDDLDPKTLAGFGHNVVEDVKGTAKGFVDLGQGLMEHPVDTIKNVPGALVGEGKRIGLGELLTGHPINAAEKFGNAAYDKPLSTLMDVAPVVGAAGKALGFGGAAAEAADAAGTAAKAAEVAGEAEKVAPAAEAATEAAKAAETGLPVVPPGAKTGPPHALFSYNDSYGPGGTPRSMYTIFGDPEHPVFKQTAPSGSGGHGSTIPKADVEALGIPITGREPRSVGKFEPLEAPGAAPKAEVPPTPPPAPSLADDAAAKANEVKNYISHGYEGFAKKPGAVSNLADYVQEKSQMMSAQQMGFTPLQNRQLGATPTEQLQTMRAIGQYGIDSNIVSPAGGLRHMVEMNAKLLNDAGETIGDLRKEADAKFDPKTMVMDPLQEIHKQLDPVFARGARSGESGAYQKALETVEDGKPTFQGMADVSTKLNHAANEANRLQQPHGAFTDIANVISRIENDRIRAILGPEKAAKYDQALKEFGINKKIEAALKRKVGGEVKRMGPGSLTSNLTQKALDEVGYRVGARAANKLATTIKGNPAAAKSLPSLFKEFANHVDETAGEVSGMYKGGRVPEDVREYVSGRGC
jgi:hypothetical protein